ncbi:MAG: prolyl oligopeptidase family serine peptidase [Anaerolineales bacterium]|nr:prolyl oligopeptidase family serine peptidase [Anaerolineales bacterium]
MRTIYILAILICLLTACAAPIASPTSITTSPPTEAPFASRETLTGEWLGGFTKSDGSVASLSLNFDEANLTIEPQTKPWPLTIAPQDDENIHFTVTGKTGEDFEQIDFTGSLSNGILTGDLNWDGQTSSITFNPIYAIDSALLENYTGVYRFESGRALSVIQSPNFEANGLSFFHQGLTITDFESGDSRGLYPLDDFTFAIGALRVVGAPLSGRVQFISDDPGQAIGLMWWDKFDGITPSAESGQYAARVNYSTEDVAFTSADGAVMAGLLTSPETSQPYSAFMMLHGSEPGVKDGFGQQVLAHYMISQGIALLTYDKRGVGDSEGGYSESANASNINLIASDAVAGADYLSTRPEIDPAKIGLIGGSQAGWVIPIAAAQSDKVSFFVINSGPVISFAQEDRYSSVTNDGDSATTYDAEKLDQTLREMQPSGVDPIPVIAELTQPGLWLWGSVDKSVPAKVSAENLQAIIDSGKSNFSYVILPNGDHNLNESAHGYFAEIPYAPRVLYFSKLTEWLEQNNLTQKE